MSNSSVFVTFGANSSELEASIAQIKAALRGYTSDLAEVARAQAKAGDSAAVEMGDKLLAAAAKVSEAKSQLRGFQEQLKEIGTGATSGAKAAAEEMNAALQGVASGGVAGTSGHGVGPGFYAREAHALLDELSSGRLQQAQGTFTNVAFTFLQGHQALIPYAAAALALGGAFAFLAIHVAEANAAIQSIRLDAAANAFQLSAEQATKLRDSIKELAGVSDSNAAAIAKPFAALGTVGGTVAELLAPSMKALAQSLNGDVGMAAEQVAQRFTDLDGAGRNFVDNLRGLTQGERDHFAQLVATGKETQAYALLIDLSARSLESLAGKRKIEAAAAIDQAAALQDAALAGRRQAPAGKKRGPDAK